MKRKQKIWIFSSAIFGSLIIFVALIISLIKSNKNEWTSLFFALGLLVILVFTTILLYFAIRNFAKSRELIKGSFNSFVEEVMSNNNIGIIIYDIDQKIIWSSNFIANKFNKDFIGLKIDDLFNKVNLKLEQNWNITETKKEFEFNHSYYEAQFWPTSNTVVIRDISSEYLFKIETWQQQPVIGELEIDNFQLFQSILSEEQLFTINKVVIDVMNEYVEKYNLIYRQYTNGKFVIFTNENSLQEMCKDGFYELMNINNRIKGQDIGKLSLSLGFAHGWSSLKEKIEQAKKALVQAQSRGGDQVTIFSNQEMPVYYGSNSEILVNNSKTKIHQIARNFEAALTNPNITQVMVYGHQFADLDAIGSALAICEIARNFDKKAYIANATLDSTAEKALRDISEKHKDALSNLFIKNPKTATKMTDANTVVVLVDNSDPNRTDNKEALINAERENIFVFDHHRVAHEVDYCPQTNVYIETGASSACEIVTEIITFFKKQIDITQIAAQLLLSGIYLDTNQFTKSVTPRSFQAAAWLESKGANAVISSEMLKVDEEASKEVQEILANTVEIKKGYYLAYTDKECSNDIISIAANELLKVRGRVASFVVARLKGTKLYKLSARGIETNVQIICEAVGGGGHFGTAAAVSDEDLETFVDNIRHAITTAGRHLNYESNSN
ncbi:DHH family phosphoesterase [Mycoplasma hafezii]|uniref:DHH family phosphoesterase n=1 Tax=Mycoplasma hafezii TaxID=525886 RepID=UPI003CFAB4D1